MTQALTPQERSAIEAELLRVVNTWKENPAGGLVELVQDMNSAAAKAVRIVREPKDSA